MPSQAVQDPMDALGDRQKASASKAPPTLAERRAAFTLGTRLHLVPDDVLVTSNPPDGCIRRWAISVNMPLTFSRMSGESILRSAPGRSGPGSCGW